MKKSNFLKCFVLMGILLFSGYFGFAQTAIIRIISADTVADFYELQYKKEGDTDWARIEITPQEVAVNGKFHTLYTLADLECGKKYEVRVHACKHNGLAGVWKSIEFTTPLPYDEAPWTWSIGPFDILCRPVGVEPTALSVLDPNVEEIWASEERDTAKEAIKEE
jgi:hypothetical protein